MHCLLSSITSGPLRNAPQYIFTSSCFLGFFKGALQPSPIYWINPKRRDFKGTFTPVSLIPSLVTLEREYVINFSDTTTSPGLTLVESKPLQKPTENTALGPKTSIAPIAETEEPPGMIEPLWHFMTAIFSFDRSSPVSPRYTKPRSSPPYNFLKEGFRNERQPRNSQSSTVSNRMSTGIWSSSKGSDFPGRFWFFSKVTETSGGPLAQALIKKSILISWKGLSYCEHITYS